MNQDLQQNQRALDDTLRNSMSNQSDVSSVKKGITGKIEHMHNTMTNIVDKPKKKGQVSQEEYYRHQMSSLRKMLSEESSIRNFMSSLSILSKNSLEIITRENSFNPGDLTNIVNPQVSNINNAATVAPATIATQSHLDEISGFQLCSLYFNGTEREPVVQRHQGILSEMNSNAKDYLMKQLNLPLDEKTGEEYLHQFKATSRLFNCQIDNLLRGIDKKEDTKQIIIDRLRLEESLQRSIVEERNNEEVGGYLISEEEGINPSMNRELDDDNANIRLETEFTNNHNFPSNHHENTEDDDQFDHI